MEFILIHNLIDPSDPQGRTYKEVNLARSHAIPLNTLVELPSGVRLYTAKHTRDCDGTPLYGLAPGRLDDEDAGTPSEHKWVWGYSERCLTVVTPPPAASPEP